jgi:uncharacterized protein YaiI (UPF0178 family)
MVCHPPSAEAQVLAIFVDGDACPVKTETYAVAGRYGVPVALVANSRMRVPEDQDVELIVVDGGFDAADDWIVDNVRAGDVVVTADVPLAARCIEAGAHALGTSGRIFSADSIGGALATRDLNAHLRESNAIGGGPPPITDRDRSRFRASLDRVVQQALREAGLG